MLTISNELKEILKHDYLPFRVPVEKSMVLYFADLNLTITDEDFTSEDCFSLEDSISEDNLTFGNCFCSCMKFQVENISQNLIGHSFTAKLIIDKTDIKLGTYIVSEAQQENADNVKEIVAYDLMKKFDRDITNWYNNLAFPMTLKVFRNSLCNYCGVGYIDSNLPNDDMTVEKTINTNQLNGRDVLKSCEELNGCFGHMNRDGKLDHVVLSKSNPMDTIDADTYNTVKFEEYITNPISKVQIRQEDGDVGAYSGTGVNCYTITGNFLAYGKSTSDLQNIADNAAVNIIGISYKPYVADTLGLPYLEVGDYISFINDKNEQVNTYVLKRLLSGVQILDDQFSCKGQKELVEDNSLNVQITQLNGKSAILKRTVEEMSNTISDLETNTTSSITQLSNEIVLKVDANGKIAAFRLGETENGTAVLIKADNIDLAGYVTISDLEGTGTVTIDGGNINAGTITADQFGTMAEGTGWKITKHVSDDGANYICGYGGDYNGASNVVVKTGGDVAFACGMDSSYVPGKNTSEANAKVQVFHDGRGKFAKYVDTENVYASTAEGFRVGAVGTSKPLTDYVATKKIAVKMEDGSISSLTVTNKAGDIAELEVTYNSNGQVTKIGDTTVSYT